MEKWNQLDGWNQLLLQWRPAWLQLNYLQQSNSIIHYHHFLVASCYWSRSSYSPSVPVLNLVFIMVLIRSFGPLRHCRAFCFQSICESHSFVIFLCFLLPSEDSRVTCYWSTRRSFLLKSSPGSSCSLWCCIAFSFPISRFTFPIDSRASISNSTLCIDRVVS